MGTGRFGGELVPRTMPQDQRRGLPAKRLGRREAVKTLGVALSGLVSPLVRGDGAPPAVSAGVPPEPSRWRPLASGSVPRALSRSEFAALEELVEQILPETDTPGAKAAGVHWYLDDAAGAEPHTRQQLAAFLRRLDERTQAACAKAFAAADPGERTRVLEGLAGENDASFAFVKGRVIDAYYKSEAGQQAELEWVGHEFYDAFPGACTHADPASHPRPRFAPRRARPGEGGAC